MNQKWTEKTHIYWSAREIWNTQFPKKKSLSSATTVLAQAYDTFSATAATAPPWKLP